MYQITCDGFQIYDPRSDELQVIDPKCSIAVNGCGSASFTVLPDHPFLDKLTKLRSVIEVRQDNDVIFRGRILNEETDFDNLVNVDVEGALACANDTQMPPFRFPEDFPGAEQSPNIVEFFLRVILDNHNQKVKRWQQLKLGTVSVRDPNNYITRSSSEYLSTWEVLKDKLFESALGGYLVPRYEADGTYIDYLADLPLTNLQHVEYGENLLKLVQESDASDTYTAVLPLGAEKDDVVLTLESLADGDINSDLVKSGNYIWSKSGFERFGWICAPTDETTWDNVTIPENLRKKAVEYLSGTAMKFTNTITINALDLHATDDEIQQFRCGRNIVVESPGHGLDEAVFPLTSLEIDLANPQNTIITTGSTVRSLISMDDQHQSDFEESVKQDLENGRTEMNEIKNTVHKQSTEILNDARQIIFGALDNYVEDGTLEDFKKTVESQFSIMANEMQMRFTSTTEQITNVNGDLQSQFTKLYKYIQFSSNGIMIQSGPNQMALQLDNEAGIVFSLNGVAFGRWDGIDFYTGNIIIGVNQRAQFGNFAIVPRSNGSLSFLKVK